MSKETGRVRSVHIGTREDMSKQPRRRVEVAEDGFVGDNHQGFTRIAYEGDKDPEGTLRRNERQWSGISADELAQISQVLNLNRALEAEDLGANLCVSGIENFSGLPRGTRLSFSSGAVLAIEEYNPPCVEMGEKLASLYATEQGDSFSPRDFVMAARRSRGVVGVVEVPGVIAQDDVVLIERPWDPFANADA